MRDFFGSPMARALSFQCGGLDSVPGAGTKTPHATTRSWHNQIKKEKTFKMTAVSPLLPYTIFPASTLQCIFKHFKCTYIHMHFLFILIFSPSFF